ncbi:MAG: MFS transporter [Dehalococcoidia bacterium]
MTEPGAREGQRRPRFFFGWYIVAASTASNALLSAAYFQGFSALFLPIESHFGWSRTTISAAFALRQLESGIGSPAVGFALGRVSARQMVFWSGVVTSLGLVGLGLINGIVTFYIFFIVISIGTSGVSHVVTWPVLIARWFNRKRGLAIGLAVLGPIFGSPFVILNTSLEEAIGWRAVLIGYGFIVFVGISFLSLLARERPQDHGMLPDGDIPTEADLAEQAAIRQGTSRRIEAGLTLRQVLHTKEFWLVTSYLGAMFIVNSAMQAHQIPYLVQDRGLSPSAAAVTLTLVFLISGFGRIGGGLLMDKSDYRFVLAVMALCMGLSQVYLQVADVHSVWTAMPYVVLFGLARGGMIPISGTLGGMMFGLRSLGQVIGLLQGGAVAAGMVGPIFLGIVFDLQGSYFNAIWVLAAIGFAIIPMTMFMSSPASMRAKSSVVQPADV